MNTEKKLGFATRQIHTGKVKNAAGSLCDPIYQTSTFEFDTVEQGGARFAGQESGYIYSRLGNPTVATVEAKLAELEGGEAALATASGMGAISTAIWSRVEADDEIVASDTLYGCTFALFNHGICKFGVKVHFIDMTDMAALKAALNEKTKVVYLETPCNPTLKIVDIAAVAKEAHAYNAGIKVIVDNTFCTPYLQRPGAGCRRGRPQRHQVPQWPRRRHRGRHHQQQRVRQHRPYVRPEGHDRRCYEPLQRLPDGPRHEDPGHPYGASLRQRQEGR